MADEKEGFKGFSLPAEGKNAKIPRLDRLITIARFALRLSLLVIVCAIVHAFIVEAMGSVGDIVTPIVYSVAALVMFVVMLGIAKQSRYDRYIVPPQADWGKGLFFHVSENRNVSEAIPGKEYGRFEVFYLSGSAIKLTIYSPVSIDNRTWKAHRVRVHFNEFSVQAVTQFLSWHDNNCDGSFLPPSHIFSEMLEKDAANKTRLFTIEILPTKPAYKVAA